MRRGVALKAAGFIVLLLSSVAASVFGTEAHQYSSPAALAAVAAAGAFLGVLVAVGLPGERARGLREWLPQAFVGAGGFAVAPWLVMANRYTDAPPGSEVVFFTTAAWGAMLAISAAVGPPTRIRRIGGVLLALAGAAAVVGNWERPSSFSPFVRYGREELLMLLAGALWVTLVLVLAAAARRKSLPAAALRASLGGIGAAIVIGGASAGAGTLTVADLAGGGLWAFGIAAVFVTASTLVLLRRGSAYEVASAYVLVPAAMTLLLLLEQVFGARGPNPLLIWPILGGTVSTAAGLWLARAERDDSPDLASRPRLLRTAGLVFGAVATCAALVALVLPGMSASVTAIRADGTSFEASFGLWGAEMAGTWLALGVAVASVGIAMRRSVPRVGWSQGAAVLAAAVAWPLAAATPLRTLTAFIPSDVQVDYGSEFARIDFSGGPPILAILALVGALFAVAVTLSYRTPVASEEVAARDEQGREVVSQ
ncbi:MAG: hypothetical protein EG823_06890 [Actinobacteria bacterium]|nr:hypothetical protein [Actinomycetota bacterium]